LLNQPFSYKIAKGYISFKPYKQGLNCFALSLFLYQNPLTPIFYTKRKLTNYSLFFYNLGVTELILGHKGLREESNYNYSKLKRKGKERESNTSYFIINTSVCMR
jgi:hypothetical protein